MRDTSNTGSLDATGAQALLQRADQISASVRTGAGWPQITTLLGIGAASSMGLLALTLAAQVPGTPVGLPITLMVAWILIFSVVTVVFSRTSKRGFGPRWGVYIGAWSLLWVAAVTGSTSVFEGELWFSGLMAVFLMLTTTACAWYEARR